MTRPGARTRSQRSSARASAPGPHGRASSTRSRAGTAARRRRRSPTTSAARTRRVGIASVYRALEVLDRLDLVHRLDVGDGTARYEAAHPGGEHHHHVVCDRCGRVAQFADDGLEQAIATLSQRLEFAIDQHDVVLRGTCPTCR